MAALMCAVNEKRGRRRKENAAMARREAPVLSRGSTALTEQWLRHLARHPPPIGGGQREGATAYPAPQRIRVIPLGCLTIEYGRMLFSWSWPGLSRPSRLKGHVLAQAGSPGQAR